MSNIEQAKVSIEQAIQRKEVRMARHAFGVHPVAGVWAFNLILGSPCACPIGAYLLGQSVTNSDHILQASKLLGVPEAWLTRLTLGFDGQNLLGPDLDAFAFGCYLWEKYGTKSEERTR